MPNKPNNLVSFPLHLPQEVERLFDEIIQCPWGLCREIRGWNPSIDLYETADAFILEADLPGVKAENLKVEIENSDLVCRVGAFWRTRPALATSTPWSVPPAISCAASNSPSPSITMRSMRSFTTRSYG